MSPTLWRGYSRVELGQQLALAFERAVFRGGEDATHLSPIRYSSGLKSWSVVGTCSATVGWM